jgi:hypothetical protein
VGAAVSLRVAAAPTWVIGEPAASATPGYPYSVQVLPETLVKSIVW